jgi:hypothetical protein
MKIFAIGRPRPGVDARSEIEPDGLVPAGAVDG